MTTEGMIFNIQHFSVDDGPGFRTVVFMKGCPLRCRWCANPESQLADAEIAWGEQSCIGCGECGKLPGLDCRFEDGAEGSALYWNPRAAFDGREVRRICPTEALHVIGRRAEASAIMEEVAKDVPFYLTSGGGLTLSGGEPLMQPGFALAVLQEAGRRHIHRAMETSAYAPFDVFRSVAGELDYLLADVKCMDEDIHFACTGVSNRRILDNLRRIRQEYPKLPIRLRTPVVPGVNDNPRELRRIAALAREIGADYELLKYHRLGEPKYRSLHRGYEMGEAELSDGRFEELKAVITEREES